MLIGTEPEREIAMTGLDERLVEGSYFEKGDQKVLLAKGVAEKLKLSINDTLILISQGYHGANAAGKYPVKGIVSFGSPELNKQMVYLPLKEAQWFYAADGLVTSIALHLEGQDQIQPTLSALKSKLDTKEYEIMDWEELLPDLVEAKALDSGGNYVVYFILYLIIAFGIFGTILMMTKEREYEFGILIAIGMKRWMLGTTIWMEVILLGLLGTILGLILSYPLVYYFHVNPIRFGGGYAEAMEKFGFEPIFPTTMKARIFLIQALVVFLITAILALFPFYKIFKLVPVKAMRD
jgi:ABC-type lipoprotein release transport system permease subunit